jgi:uncharacterized MnhB-related membrane protein
LSRSHAAHMGLLQRLLVSSLIGVGVFFLTAAMLDYVGLESPVIGIASTLVGACLVGAVLVLTRDI